MTERGHRAQIERRNRLVFYLRRVGKPNLFCTDPYCKYFQCGLRDCNAVICTNPGWLFRTFRFVICNVNGNLHNLLCVGTFTFLSSGDIYQNYAQLKDVTNIKVLEESNLQINIEVRMYT